MKIHAASNQDGFPLKFELTPGQAHDAPLCETLLTGLQPGQSVLADKAYDADWIRKMIWEQGAIDVIRPSPTARSRRNSTRNCTGSATKSNAFSVASRLPSAASTHDTNKHLETSSR